MPSASVHLSAFKFPHHTCVYSMLDQDSLPCYMLQIMLVDAQVFNKLAQNLHLQSQCQTVQIHYSKL